MFNIEPMLNIDTMFHTDGGGASYERVWRGLVTKTTTGGAADFA